MSEFLTKLKYIFYVVCGLWAVVIGLNSCMPAGPVFFEIEAWSWFFILGVSLFCIKWLFGSLIPIPTMKRWWMITFVLILPIVGLSLDFYSPGYPAVRAYHIECPGNFIELQFVELLTGTCVLYIESETESGLWVKKEQRSRRSRSHSRIPRNKRVY